MTDPAEVRSDIQNFSSEAVERINDFSEQTFQTRGERAESGMGQLIEALWGYYVNSQLKRSEHEQYELAWLPHQYNDFACLERDAEWNPDRGRSNELLRIEAKTMYMDADESKGHFEGLIKNIEDNDLLLVMLWRWEEVDEYRASPHIEDVFIDRAKPLAKFRDDLHLARGGDFLDPSDCPDCADAESCVHAGEPLNSAGNRERIHGPEGLKPSGSSYGANFGGLVRMLGTSSDKAKETYDYWRANNQVVDKYITFIHSNFPQKEGQRYNTDEWKEVAKEMDIPIRSSDNKSDIVDKIKDSPNYQEVLKETLCPDDDPREDLWSDGGQVRQKRLDEL